jgi:2-oxo-4-hydroxy-4-carboxy-5-ureidoimidazoline decarboxylase|eukprot:evm.model.NODE_31567_length_81678_cov_30.212677.11
MAKSGADGPAWEADEQKGTEGASEEILQSLVEHNRLYKERFGYIFLVCATGKTADEMLTLLKARMRNEAGYELTVAAGEQSKITVLRLHKLLTSMGAQEDTSRL